MSKYTKLILPVSLILLAIMGVYFAFSRPILAKGIDKVKKLTSDIIKPAGTAHTEEASKEGKNEAVEEKKGSVNAILAKGTEKVEYPASAVIAGPKEQKTASLAAKSAPAKTVEVSGAASADGHKVVGTKQVYVTAYSSTPDQTDSSPFITASNTHVRDGIIAANFLPFGTKVRFPAIYPDKIFVVEDRMNKKYNQRADIWFPTRQEALNFGIKFTDLEVLAVK